jgi:hypothetical protein
MIKCAMMMHKLEWNSCQKTIITVTKTVRIEYKATKSRKMDKISIRTMIFFDFT